MEWSFTDDRPIYAQLVEQMQRRIVSGRFRPGEQLPSVREMAGAAAVNPNTMQKAMSELERSGLVFAQRTTGRFVTQDEALIRQTRDRLAEEQLRLFFQQMGELGYTLQEAQTLLRREMEEAES